MNEVIETWQEVSEGYDFAELYLQKLHAESQPEQRRLIARDAKAYSLTLIISLARLIDLIDQLEKQKG